MKSIYINELKSPDLENKTQKGIMRVCIIPDQTI